MARMDRSNANASRGEFGGGMKREGGVRGQGDEDIYPLYVYVQTMTGKSWPWLQPIYQHATSGMHVPVNQSPRCRGSYDESMSCAADRSIAIARRSTYHGSWLLRSW